MLVGGRLARTHTIYTRVCACIYSKRGPDHTEPLRDCNVQVLILYSFVFRLRLARTTRSRLYASVSIRIEGGGGGSRWRSDTPTKRTTESRDRAAGRKTSRRLEPNIIIYARVYLLPSVYIHIRSIYTCTEGASPYR